jgi:hypothetical protein
MNFFRIEVTQWKGRKKARAWRALLLFGASDLLCYAPKIDFGRRHTRCYDRVLRLAADQLESLPTLGAEISAFAEQASFDTAA